MAMPEFRVAVDPESGGAGTPKIEAPRPHAAGLNSAIALLEQAAQTVPLPTAPYPIVIADYGVGTGRNSMRPISAAIAALRHRTRPEHSVLVTHTDIADNDFTAVFRCLADNPDSYLRRDSSTFPSAVGRSFYSQILPSKSVHVGWSAWAIVRLGRVPMPVSDHIAAAFSGDPEVVAAYARQAAFDWHEFVAFRGRELASGAQLVVLTTGLGDDGDFGYRPLLTAVVDTLRELTADGVVRPDELQRMSLPIVGRRANDFMAPFAPSGRFEGLSISHLEAYDAEDVIFTRYRNENDANAFGLRWADFCRFTLFNDLCRPLGDDAARCSQFHDRLHAGIAARMSANPEPMRIPLAQLVLEKRRRAS
jgi:hypothetical protein